jgi:cation diffusion facilitator family transporter
LQKNKLEIIGNVTLSMLIIIEGIVCKSMVLVSTGIYLLSNICMDLIDLVGFKLFSKKPDKAHPYGHEKFEAVISIVASMVIFLSGLGIIYKDALDFKSKEYLNQTLSILALVLIIISIIVKEWNFKKTKDNLEAKNLERITLAICFLGVLLNLKGFFICDVFLSLLVGLLVLKKAINIFLQAIGNMIDESVDEDTYGRLKDAILEFQEVLDIDDLKTRKFGNYIYVDVEVLMDGELSLITSHNVVEAIHDKIELEFPKVKHCMIHANPK